MMINFQIHCIFILVDFPCNCLFTDIEYNNWLAKISKLEHVLLETNFLNVGIPMIQKNFIKAVKLMVTQRYKESCKYEGNGFPKEKKN